MGLVVLKEIADLLLWKIATTGSPGGGGGNGGGGGGSGGNKDKIIERQWEKHSVSDPDFQNNCKEVAEQIQEYIGGEVYRIEPNKLFAPGINEPFLGPIDGYTTGWKYHVVVVKESKVYDVFTGYQGQTFAEYMARWEYSEAIIWPWQ